MADITVRHTEPSDFEAVQRIFTQPEAFANTLQLPYPSRESWRKKLADPPPGLYSLVACIGEEVVGQAGLHVSPRPRQRHVGDVGIAVRDDWQSKGVGTRLMSALLELADGWLNLTRLELTVFSDNAPAIALYEKFGFVREGTHRQHSFRAGVFVDAYTMARLRDS